VPKTVEIRPEPLPLSGAMKILKRELRLPIGKDTNGTSAEPKSNLVPTLFSPAPAPRRHLAGTGTEQHVIAKATECSVPVDLPTSRIFRTLSVQTARIDRKEEQ
jgi:hypothetical protein